MLMISQYPWYDFEDDSWWRHELETFSAILAICAGNPPVTGEFPAQMPVTRSFDVFFDLRLTKRLSKQSRGWWFKTPSRFHFQVVTFLVLSSLASVYALGILATAGLGVVFEIVHPFRYVSFESTEPKCYIFRTDSRFAPSQWEMSLQSNAVSHWLGANLKSALIFLRVWDSVFNRFCRVHLADSPHLQLSSGPQVPILPTWINLTFIYSQNSTVQATNLGNG